MTGKRPVRSVLTFPVNSIVCRYAILVWTLYSCEGRGGVVITGGLEMLVSGEVFLVDRTFCWSWRSCPFAVAMLLGKCFQTRADVKPGHVVKKTAVIAGVHDDTARLKYSLWKYYIMSDLVERVWTLFVYLALVRGVGGQFSRICCRCYAYLLVWCWGRLNLLLWH